MAHKFGFNEELMMELSLGQSFFEVPKDDYNLAEIASGFNKKTMISPIHAAVLSSVIANDGVIKYPFIVSKLTDNKKRELLVKPALLEKRVIKKSTSKLISKAMESTVKKGTARKSFRRFDRFLREELRIGGKTGSITGGIPFGKRDWFSAFAVPKNKKLGEGISISVMNINVDKWFVRSTYLAKEVIDYYYKEINPLKEIITSLNKNKSEEKI
jgi:membrane peptidoglycan carboxypeptidase